jgi:hypothetical protein
MVRNPGGPADCVGPAVGDGTSGGLALAVAMAGRDSAAKTAEEPMGLAVACGHRAVTTSATIATATSPSARMSGRLAFM